MKVQEIIDSDDIVQQKALFNFDNTDSNEAVLLKFNLWARFFFVQYFKVKDAPFHKDIDSNNLKLYRGQLKAFINLAFRGASKRQPLNAKVMTPMGWSTIGKLVIGDYVIGSDGKKNKVLDLSPIVDRPIFELTTEDGRKTQCDSEHLWTVRKMSNVKQKHETITVQHMLDKGYFYNREDKRYGKLFKEYKYAIETVKAIDFPEKKFLLDPYLLGIILGDGNIGKEYGGVRLCFHKDDDRHYRDNLKKQVLSDTKYDKRNTNVGVLGINGIGKSIKKLGLNVSTYNKFIPDEYLFGSIEQRKALLEGLMDTDGSVCLSRKRNTSSFSNTSERLIDGVVDLVRSLGGKAIKKKRKGCKKFNGKVYYTVSIWFTDYKPFRLKRKLDNCGLATQTWSRIVSIVPIGNKLGRCISTQNEDGLYVTDDYLLTHNTTRTKLFLAFCIANDTEHTKKYFKVLSHDATNCRQFVTDVYNMLIDPRVKQMYPEIFEKTDSKREETMGSFTTATGVKVLSDTVGSSQRGAIQEDSRPDIILFDDFETRETLRSAIKTKTIWDNMQEAKDGLAYNGGCLYLGNYISELGNVHRLVDKKDYSKAILTTPIIENGIITWQSRYTHADIEFIKRDSDDFEGEYLCRPSASKDVYFDRESLDRMPIRQPIQEISSFKMFRKYNPSHRYAGGHDVAGGVGLDSSTSVFIDFDHIPAQVVATYHSNEILPEAFGNEIYHQANRFGGCLIAPENNAFDQVILKARQLGAKLYTGIGTIAKIHAMAPTTFGWRTDSNSKDRMMSSLRQAIESGWIDLNDEDLINEAKSYTRNDIIDNPVDIRLTTRHFDLLTACAIAWQMKTHTRPAQSLMDVDEWKNSETNPAI